MGNNYIEQRHKTIEQRFWEKVDKKGPIHPILGTMCWVWTASLKKDGYGNIGIVFRFFILAIILPAVILSIYFLGNQVIMQKIVTKKVEQTIILREKIMGGLN
jgi:hypothetical protein